MVYVDQEPVADVHAVPCNRTSAAWSAAAAAATQSLVLSSSSVAMSIVNLLGIWVGRGSWADS
jgi:hypothetical protein